MRRVLITGTSSGIGLELTRQYAEQNWSVIATARRLSPELEEVATLFPHIKFKKVDVTSNESIHTLKQSVGNQPIDVLINNAAVFNSSSFGNIDYDEFRTTLNTNTIAPLQMIETLVDNIASSEEKTIINLTGHLASFDFINKNPNYFPGYYSYKVSKTALNMVTNLLAQELRPRAIKVVALSPGWVETKMGGAKALLTPAQAVKAMRTFIDQLTLSHSGRFFENGEEFAW